MTNLDNIILATDSYKLNHWHQYPEGTEAVYSYFESRPGAKWDTTTFFGLQYILERYLTGKVVTRADIDHAADLATYHFGDPSLYNLAGWEHIYNEHDGHLPLRIKAVPEGIRVPTGNVLMTVENTCPRCFWLTNAVESLLTHVWAPSTVATLSHSVLQLIKKYVIETGGDVDMVKFQLHDFGYRGASSHESAAIAGAGHLIDGRGTDTLPAMQLLMDYYQAGMDEIAFSVPATEHSVMTSLGKDGEMQIVDRLLDEYPKGIISVVADSYNIYNFVKEIGTTYKDRILARDGKFVVRPDSVTEKDPYPRDLMTTLSNELWEDFGGSMNDAGYAVFDPHVGLLWGDGIDPEGINSILGASTSMGFCASNYVFGMGGGLLQKINRDMQRFAFKCSAQKRGGEWIDICKNPLDASKASKKGRFQLEHNKHGWFTTQLTGEGKADSEANLLKTVFEDGKMVHTYTLAEIRANAEACDAA